MLTRQEQGSKTMIRSTRFVDDGIVPALTGFHAALASRWLELVAAAITANSWEFPVVIQAGPARAANPRNKPYDGPAFEPPFAEFPHQQDPVSPPLWDFSDYWARLHIDQSHCRTLAQIQSNQYDPDSLASMAPCEGRVDRGAPEPGSDPS